MSTPNVIINTPTNNVVINTGTDEENIVFSYAVTVSSFPSVNIVNVTDNAGISVLSANFAPSNTNSVGIAGELRWDSNYLYVCVASNTWKKITLSDL